MDSKFGNIKIEIDSTTLERIYNWSQGSALSFHQSSVTQQYACAWVGVLLVSVCVFVW